MNILHIFILVFFIVGCSKNVEDKDLYVNRLVYRKIDSTLFTGTLEVNSKASRYYVSFCKGVPCGEWGEFERGGGVVQKGKYLENDILSKSTQTLIGTDTFLINYWQESELPAILYPPFFTIIILKEDDFFQSELSGLEGHMDKLANAVIDDTRDIKYEYLSIRFANAVHDWTKESTKKYKLKDGLLISIP